MTTENIPVASFYSNQSASDEDLVVRAIEGDSWAEEAIFRKYVGPITSVAAKLLRRRSEVEDVVQDTFIQAFRDLHQLKSASKLGPWLTSIAVRRVHAIFRSRKWKKMLWLDTALDDERLSDQVRTEASQEILTEISMLDEAFDRMDLIDKTCWVLRHLEGYQLGEIARITRLSLATVKRRIASASKLLEIYTGQRGSDD